MQAYGQVIKAYDDYISIVNKKNYVIKITHNDNYSGSISVKIVSFSQNGDPGFSPTLAGINIKVSYENESNNFIEYEICNKNKPAECSRAFVYINITKDKISAANDIYNINNKDKQKFKVLENDLYSNSVTLEISTNPKFGSFHIAENKIIYQPDHLKFSKDSLEYKITDKSKVTSKAYVYIYNNNPTGSDNSPPEIREIFMNGKEDQPIAFQLSQFTKAYSDKENDDLKKIKFLSVPTHGTIYYNNQQVKNGNKFGRDQIQYLKYVPDPDFFGSDEVKWHAADHLDYAKSPSKIYFEITSVNDAPVAVNDSYNIKEGENVQFDVLENDYDPEKSALNISKVDIDAKFGKATVVNNKIQYKPASQFNGKANFSYTISDGDLTASAEINVNIAPVYEPPQALPFTIQSNEDEIFEFRTKNFTDNYKDPDGQDLTHISFTVLPKNVQLYVDDEKVIKNQKIKLEDINKLTYRPAQNYFGSDQASYIVFDANNQSSPATITINIQSVNDLPTAVDDSGYTIDEEEPIIIDVLK
ncbi:MAG: Ig-like domain-containing protein, partial [Cyclobacteriaceae bacterium]